MSASAAPMIWLSAGVQFRLPCETTARPCSIASASCIKSISPLSRNYLGLTDGRTVRSISRGKLYDRRQDEISLDEVERIAI